MLGDLERAVMDVAWARPHVTVREVVSALVAGRKPAYTTVMTVMNRLVEKGILKRRQNGQSYRYAATMTRCEFLKACSREVVDTLVRCYGTAAIAPLTDAIGRAGK